MKAVLFVGHGSRDPEGNEQIRQFIDELIPELEKGVIYETCFLEFEQPNITKGIDTCVTKGATSVALVPLMLLPAGHSKIHIPHEIDEAKEKYPAVRFTYGKPIGIHYEAVDICKNRVLETGDYKEGSDEKTAVILLGRGGSDADANSDLFKITRLLWEKLRVPIIETAFIGVTSPSLEETVEKTIRLGAEKVIILPYFLFTGVLIKRLENMTEQFRVAYPGISFSLAEYFGFHPKLKIVVKDRVEEVLKGEVYMNCDTCQYRFEAMEHIDHHHHHDHDHDHHHDHPHDHSHEGESEAATVK
ncbi:sirohydrochlorin chelatase [Pseudobacillus wudalianchiensis]|uniref:Sirohydrochlorin cobaltochelatase n=1 Tax=Pseudobacillus wudalianchiensis TaxID=1743143 RepID=A0A1B9AN24_9BACI|nr:sirohydrochlorin chelatase [Bacillus wudalianchiensis]OCA85195.1 sirohydrochlorin cobaltochelatase [Bacillus wudalianchiensis]